MLYFRRHLTVCGITREETPFYRFHSPVPVRVAESLSDAYRHFYYREHSYYPEQLECLFQYFHKKRFFIELSENFYSGMNKFMRRVFSFLEVDTSVSVPDLTLSNFGMERPEDVSLRSELKSYFEPYNRRFETCRSGILALT